MPRPKGSPNKKGKKIKYKFGNENENVMKSEASPEVEDNSKLLSNLFESGNHAISTKIKKAKCISCQLYKREDLNFYISHSILFKGNNSRMCFCRECLHNLYLVLYKKYGESKKALYTVCRYLDIYFDLSLFAKSDAQATNTGEKLIGLYMKAINSFPQYKNKAFEDSTIIVEKLSVFEEYVIVLSSEDKQNKDDVIRMVGYDPFENDNEADKKYLYNTLVDFLDESTLDDSFKLPIVIEIVKSFNQLEKINQALSMLTADVNSVANQSSSMKALFETKNKIYSSILSMAKDNGISVNHSNNKSKGAGTLSGLMKQMQEKGFLEAEVNLFDIETCEGIRQVADISNESIKRQLQFDENDYVVMINSQRELIMELDKKYKLLEEENRLIKLNDVFQSIKNESIK